MREQALSALSNATSEPLFGDAEFRYREAREIFVTLGDPRSVHCSRELARIFHDVGQPESCQREIRAVLEMDLDHLDLERKMQLPLGILLHSLDMDFQLLIDSLLQQERWDDATATATRATELFTRVCYSTIFNHG